MGETRETAMPLKHFSAYTGRNMSRSGDVALFRRPQSLIARSGRGVHSHAGMLAWWGGDLMLVEVREFSGGRVVWFDDELARRGVEIDVYRPAVDSWPRYDVGYAIREMRRLAGCRYGWVHLLLVALRHVPSAARFLPPVAREAEDHGIPPFCSEAVSFACRVGGGVDPVPGLADRLTEPADLARSSLLSYQFTIAPPAHGPRRRAFAGGGTS